MSKWKNPESWILLGSSSLLLYFAAMPLVLLIFHSLMPHNIGNYLLILSRKSSWSALLNTLYLCAGTTVFTILLGLPLAWLLYKTDIPKKSLWKSLLAIPYIIPPYIGAIAWIRLLNPASGVINTWLRHFFNLDSPPFNIYSLGGAIWVHGLFFYSFIFLACWNALEKMDPALEEAALMCGASRRNVWRHITLPLITPALMNGALLVFMATAASFGVAALLMMPVRRFVLTTKIYNDVLSYSGGIAQATTLSVILMLFSLVALWISHRLTGKRQFTTITGKYGQTSPWRLKKWKWPIVTGFILLVSVIVFIPTLTLVISSLLKIYGNPMSLSNLSFSRYRYVLLELAHTQEAFRNSFIFSALAATMAVWLGAIVAYLKVKTTIRWRHWVDFLATLPYVTPGIVVAIGLIVAFSGGAGLNLYNTLWILIAAYTVKYISFAIRNTAAALEQVDKTLEEAGRVSGASWLSVFTKILVPILKPTLISSWFLIFMPAFGELTMSIMLVGPQTHTIGTMLFNLQNYDDPQSAAVLATVVLFVILGSQLIARRFFAYGSE